MKDMDDMNEFIDPESEENAADSENVPDSEEDELPMPNFDGIEKMTGVEAELKKEKEPATARLIYSAYSDMKPSPSSKYAPVSVAAYVLLYIIGAIPAVGLVASLIIALLSKKVAYRRASAALFIFELALAVILAAAFILSVYVIHVISFDDMMLWN